MPAIWAELVLAHFQRLQTRNAAQDFGSVSPAQSAFHYYNSLAGAQLCTSVLPPGNFRRFAPQPTLRIVYPSNGTATPPAPLPSPLPHPPPLLDPLRRPPSQWESSKPPTLRERWRTSDGGRAMADGVMADEQKFVSPAAGIRTRTPTNARLSR
ncbi:hypothetical protein J6590_013818 [Homalodisca vitripennis]|nr:hypothetical protein J6590_013818 [Homalodisca vitripennis]